MAVGRQKSIRAEIEKIESLKTEHNGKRPVIATRFDGKSGRIRTGLWKMNTPGPLEKS
jgi:hypothetical protein